VPGQEHEIVTIRLVQSVVLKPGTKAAPNTFLDGNQVMTGGKGVFETVLAGGVVSAPFALDRLGMVFEYVDVGRVSRDILGHRVPYSAGGGNDEARPPVRSECRAAFTS
jgi:hypothetical protein